LLSKARKHELLIRQKQYELRQIQETYKKQLSDLQGNRDKWLACFGQNIKVVIENGAEWQDVQTGATVVGLQTLEQLLNNVPQLSIEFTPTATKIEE